MSFEAALLAWLAYISSLGVDLRAQFNPPATEAQIAAAEERIGYRLPDDLRALYRIADGQQEMDVYAERHAGSPVAALFGQYVFVSLDEAVRDYGVWREIYDEAGPNFRSEYGWTTARAGDPVYPDYWHPGWFPFANDGGGNAYAVDLSPAPGGTYGQIILIGRDEDERRVLAPSLSAFMAASAQRRPPVTQRDGPWIGFDMERGQ